MNTESLLAIIGMALVTYATRVAGVWVVSQFSESDRLKRAVSYLPGSVLISIVLPPLLQKGIPEATAGALTLISAALFKNLFISILVGIVSIVILRGF